MLSSFRQVRAGERPDLSALLDTFAEIVTGRDFPCTFARLPFASDQIYFDLVGNVPGSDDDVASVLVELCTRIRSEPDAVAVIFVAEPAVGAAGSLADDFSRCRRILRAVERRNTERGNAPSPVSPQHPLWSLTLDGMELFVNFSTPRHRHRRSRAVGPMFTVIAQARSSFDKVSRFPGARQRIRTRLSRYDAAPPHPCLGTYGDQDNREALQYFLGDSQEAWDPTQGWTGA